MYPEFQNRSYRRSKESSALIITLGALVLISAILLVFFDQSTTNRQISFSSAGQYRADVAAHTALDTITGDLRTEITAGSIYTSTNGGAYASAIALPCRMGDQGFTNLVKQSAALTNFWTGANYNSTIKPPVRAVANSTQTPSMNGRVIKINRWNKSGLLGDPGSGLSPQIPAGYVAPDWIVLTRQGAVTNAATSMPTLAQLSDRSSGNSDCAIGRYAYTIYDEGALLDVNVAGYPDSGANSLAGSTFSTQRGTLPQVNLTNLLANPAINDTSASSHATALVNWRNATTATTPTTYTNYVSSIGATNGFTSVASGDQAFINRQDMIQFIKTNSSIPTAALPFLGTFTRDSDQPSWYPDPVRTKVVASGSSSDDALNPDVKTVLVQNPFVRPDNTTATVGEALLKHRFPLSRLALLANPTGNTGGATNASLIRKYFCMQTRLDGTWDYVDPDTGAVATTLPSIKTLAQVAATSPGREPTYWELLQAGILTGSLGVEMTGTTVGFTITQNQSPSRQVLSLGLNIIDQYDADDIPTVLMLGGTSQPDALCQNLFVAGVENLPYISWIAQQHFRDRITTITPATDSNIVGYLLFLMWNPHRNASSAAAGDYRLRVNGETYIFVKDNQNPRTGNSPPVTHTDTILHFSTTTQKFDQINPIMPSSMISDTTDFARFPPASTSPREVGIFMGKFPTLTSPDTVTTGDSFQMLYNQPITIVLEKQVGSLWIPYAILPRYNLNQSNTGYKFADVSTKMNAGSFDNSTTVLSAVASAAHSDPRSNRFGMSPAGGGPTPNMLQYTFNLVSGAGTTEIQMDGLPNVTSPFTSAVTPMKLWPAAYAFNQTGDPNSYYTDRDGVVRKGDSNPAALGTHGVESPFYSASNSARSKDGRPIMLNRSFASVAEMGYAFRDDPWRTLNFSSADSADGGLLDLFCLNENDNATRAGVVNLNSASQEVLKALLLNASQDPGASPAYAPLTVAQADTIATAIRTQLGSRSSPAWVMKNSADLATLITKISSSLPKLSTSPNQNDTFKFTREAIIRSFADVANTRTWNLMIDVIAQSGRYTTTAKSLNDFTVEGERRYWLHLALDRFTGKIVDMQIEPVTE